MSERIGEYFANLRADVTPPDLPAKIVPPVEIADRDVVNLMDKMFDHAISKGASDIHLENLHGDSALVRMRTEGRLSYYGSIGKEMRELLVSRIKVLAGMDITVRQRAQDGKIRHPVPNSRNHVNIRVASIPTLDNMEDLVMRILPPGKPIPLPDIGMHPSALNRLYGILERNDGIIFVCGPTGSGKTTTLHSIIHHINNPEVKIWTAEDPIEITQDGLRQVQVNVKTGYDFASILRAFLRGDPDVIMVGEMRDRETFATGIEAALTGHLLLSTLHTNSVVEAISRFLIMGINPFNLSDAILGGISQRLAPTLCIRCKEAYTPNEAEIKTLIYEYCTGLSGTDLYSANPNMFVAELYRYWVQTYGVEGKLKLYRAKGCRQCDKGYKGRTGLYEFLENSENFRSAINRNVPSDVLQTIALDDGMMSIKMDATIKIIAGLIDFRQLQRLG